MENKAMDEKVKIADVLKYIKNYFVYTVIKLKIFLVMSIIFKILKKILKMMMKMTIIYRIFFLTLFKNLKILSLNTISNIHPQLLF